VLSVGRSHAASEVILLCWLSRMRPGVVEGTGRGKNKEAQCVANDGHRTRGRIKQQTACVCTVSAPCQAVGPVLPRGPSRSASRSASASASRSASKEPCILRLRCTRTLQLLERASHPYEVLLTCAVVLPPAHQPKTPNNPPTWR
jgi:hypothetical protein